MNTPELDEASERTGGWRQGATPARDWPAALLPYALLSPKVLWLLLFMAEPLELLLAISIKSYEPGRGIIELCVHFNSGNGGLTRSGQGR